MKEQCTCGKTLGGCDCRNYKTMNEDEAISPMKHTPFWPDNIREKMIEKSKFYQEPQIYQYGFYDGFQMGIQNDILREALENLIKDVKKTGTWTRHQAAINKATEALTQYNKA